MRYLLRLGTAMLVGVALVFGGAVGAQGTPSGDGMIRVTFSSPDGVAGQLNLESEVQRFVASKAPEGTGSVVEWTAPSGRYGLEADPVMSGTQRYVAVADKLRNIQVMPGETTDVTVEYRLSRGLQEVRLVGDHPDSVTLAWTAPEGTDVLARRTVGTEPATSPSEGVEVLADAAGLVDTGLDPGTRYTYALWATPGDAAFGVNNRGNPVVFTVGTPDPANLDVASYTVQQGTVLADADDILSAQPTGTGVVVVLAAGVEAPAPGASIVLPASATLAAGLVGVVEEVSLDGRTLLLRAGGVGDSLDFYHVEVADLGALPMQRPERTANAPLARHAPDAAQAELDARGPANPDEAQTLEDPAPPQESPVACDGSSGKVTDIEFDPGFELEGHFNATIDKHNTLGFEIPEAVSIDTQAAVTLSGALSAKFSAEVACGVDIPVVMVPFAAGPVPMAFYFEPTVELGVSGALEVANYGAAVTLGFQSDGRIGLDGDNSFDGDIIAELQPLTPRVSAVSAEISLELGGTALIGPGSGTTGAGVIGGIGGTFVPLKASAEVSVGPEAPTEPCVKLEVGGEVGIILSVRAWTGPFEFSADYEIPGLKGEFPFPGSPWTFPEGCDDPPTPPSDDILGDGVTLVDDRLEGQELQRAHLDALTPAGPAWVLSTGNANRVPGAPSDTANTLVGGAGHPGLTSISGNETFDTASYHLRLIATGDTLHVRYLFGSEEYPEWVQRGYNDAMAIFVNGQNCAYVPGTTRPVAVNTINDHTNSQWFVDNAGGAPGYSTALDGLTLPLECAVSVPPGVPIDVEVAIADGGDRVLDSIVAVVDQGIWSD